MYDPSNLLSHILDATDDPLPATLLRPVTPVTDGKRTLRRTMSYASIDTVCPPSRSRGIRRRINDIAESLKDKSAKRKPKDASSQGVAGGVHYTRTDSKALQASKATAREPNTLTLLGISLGSEEDKVPTIADRLYGSIPSEQDMPSTTFFRCEPIPLIDEPLPGEDEQTLVDDLFPNWKYESKITADGQITFEPRKIKVDIKDVRLIIQPPMSDLTIWDGLKAKYHLYKCRLVLQCNTYPYDSVPIPDIRLFEMHCKTHPITGIHYTRLPAIQTIYRGASPIWEKTSNGVPKVRIAEGIHVDRLWRTIREDDGTWGWYRDAYVPLSSRLFDKMDYREFKLVSRVWLGENYVEGESTIGISMLLREVEMKSSSR